ncbi:MAG TPA: AMP-binding protein, partial [Burkholderiaceae bacterium]|nr:AMP-binding protein [Burkholderiaceae bacterium]
MRIELNERTLPRLLARQAALHGERPFLAIAGAQWSHREAADVAARRGAALREAGIGRGDRVAVMCGNRAEFIETVLGCGWIGAVVVPINGASMGPQIGYVLGNSGARLLVIEGRYLERLSTADVPRTGLQTTWTCGEPSPRGSWPAAGDAIPAAEIEPGDPLAILYTSGTTGPAKGVLCSHAQYVAWGLNTADVLGLTPHDVLATTLPLFHINALNTYAQAAVTGCRVEFLEKFSASGFWSAMRRCDATVVYLLGAMVPILLAQAASGAEREHRVRIGLGPGVPAAANEAFRSRTGVTLLEGYGSTETNFVIATAPDSPRRGVMGWLRPGFDARVVDEHDAELPPGAAGELVLRADEPYAFASGYFGMPER